MAFEINKDNTVSVAAYSLHEFAFDLTYLGSKGFTCSLENSKCPWGGIGGGVYYATLVKLTDFYIDKDGNHVNVPKEDDEVQTEGKAEQEVEQEATVKTSRTRNKKTT